MFMLLIACTLQQCAGDGPRLPGASVWGMMVVVRVSRQT